MPVRSLRIARGTSAPAGTGHTIYTVPAGRTAIVKDIRLFAGSGAVSIVAIGMTSGPTTVNLFAGSMTDAEERVLEGFIVMEPGDSLYVFSSGGTFAYWVSGAELEGVAP